MKVVRFCIGLFLVGLVPAACGGNSFSTEEPYKRSVSEVPYYLAAYTCAALDKCSPFMAELFFGPNDCTDLLTHRLEAASQQNLVDAVAAGTMKFDESKLDTCLNKIEALGCAALDNVYIAACESALGGTVAEGGECAFDGECRGDAYCKYDGTCPGTCTTRELAGDALCRDDAECQPGDKCFGGKCTQRLAAGAACTKDDVGCRSGYVCSPDSGSGRTCVAIDSLFGNAAGEACNIVQTSLCEQGSYCAVTAVSLEGATQTCVEQSMSGAACNFSYPDMCPDDQYCAGTAITATPTPIIEGSCRLLPVQNEPCTGLAQLGRLCAENHVCVTTAEGAVCHRLQENGKVCGAPADCYSENCVIGVCAPKADCEVGSAG